MYIGLYYKLFHDTYKPVKSRWQKLLPGVRFACLATGAKVDMWGLTENTVSYLKTVLVYDLKTNLLRQRWIWEILSQILGFHLIHLIPTAPDIVILLPITLWCCIETRFQKRKITNKFHFSNIWYILNYNINHSMKAINRSCIYAH